MALTTFKPNFLKGAWLQFDPNVDGFLHNKNIDLVGGNYGVAFSNVRHNDTERYTAPADFVFCGADGEPVDDFNKTFCKVLKGLKLLDDRWGKRRTVYSLRHFYCTQSLLSGVPIHVLAKNMGTSIAYIEQHYSHVLTVMQAKQLRTKKFRTT